VDRFSIYKDLKARIQDIQDPGMRESLDIMLSPLYLYAIRCWENDLEPRFSELSLQEKIKAFPGRISSKLAERRRRKRISMADILKKGPQAQKEILFYPVEPTHLRQMIPVSNNLPKEKYVYVTDRYAIYEELKRLHIACKLIPEVAGQNQIPFDYWLLGRGITPEDKKSKWNQFCEYQLNVKLFRIGAAIARTIELVKPKKVVVGYDITPEGRYSVRLCEKLDIRSICIQHGSIAGEPMDGEHIAGTYILYGEQAKRYLAGIGNEEAKLKVFGAPYLDTINYDQKGKNELIKELGLALGNKTVLVALSGPGHCTTWAHFQQIVGSMVRFAKQSPNVNVIFKLHRKDRKENYLSIFIEEGFTCPVIDARDKRFSTDIFFWLNAVDALITGSSTVALESMLKGKPVITVDYQKEYRDIDFIDMGCTFQVIDESQLSPTVSEVLSLSSTQELHPIQRNARSYINEYFYSEKEPASQRIANWLLK